MFAAWRDFWSIIFGIGTPSDDELMVSIVEILDNGEIPLTDLIDRLDETCTARLSIARCVSLVLRMRDADFVTTREIDAPERPAGKRLAVSLSVKGRRLLDMAKEIGDA